MTLIFKKVGFKIMELRKSTPQDLLAEVGQILEKLRHPPHGWLKVSFNIELKGYNSKDLREIREAFDKRSPGAAPVRIGIIAGSDLPHLIVECPICPR